MKILTMALIQRFLLAILALTFAGTALADFDGPAPIAWRWAERINARPSGSPIVENGRVYAAVGSRMYCLDLETGNQIWRYPLGAPLETNFLTGAMLAGDVLIAADDDKTVYAVDKETGKRLWLYLADSSIISTPVFAADSVVFGMASGEIMAVNLTTGQPIWPNAINLGESLYSSMDTWQDNVIVFTSAAKIYSISIVTRRINWVKSFTRLSPTVGAKVYGDVIYLNSDNYVNALRANSGRPIWQRLIRGRLLYEPAVSTTGVAVVTESGILYSLNIGNGRLMTGNGVDLESLPVSSPLYAGDHVIVPTANGSVNMVHPVTGDVVWNFTVPPMIKGLKYTVSGGGTGAGAGAGSGTGRAGDGGLGGGGGSGGQTAGSSDDAEIEIKYVIAAAAPTIVDDTMLMLARDGSILSFDDKFGVDLTPPSVRMAWPNAGDQISGAPPTILVFIAQDLGSGINFDTLQVAINGTIYNHEVDREGRIWIRIYSNTVNRPMAEGRAQINVSLSDWMGNRSATTFVLTVDNDIRTALGGPRRLDDNTGDAGNRGGLGGGGGGYGGGRGGGGGRTGGGA
ncbi:MAG: PQQ-binding-like beta-propeller repeat protein [Armatimonadetes bacterium]|nr:PQQ-binding-like beta-propeller repeat protein [Armatimonadota bacterium]